MEFYLGSTRLVLRHNLKDNQKNLALRFTINRPTRAAAGLGEDGNEARLAD